MRQLFQVRKVNILGRDIGLYLCDYDTDRAIAPIYNRCTWLKDKDIAEVDDISLYIRSNVDNYFERQPHKMWIKQSDKVFEALNDPEAMNKYYVNVNDF